MVDFYDNAQYGHGIRSLFGSGHKDKQAGVAYSRYSVQTPQGDTGLGYHEVTAYDSDHNEVGSLQWHKGTGEILDVRVDPQHRRQGVATALHHMAGKLSGEYGLTGPTHSNDRSDQGDSWAKKVGGELPARIKLSDLPDMNAGR